MVPRSVRISCRGLTLLLFSGITLTAIAQEELEEVVVTGSYISRPADRPQPVQILEAATLANEQRNHLSEIFRDLSITSGSFTGYLNADENFGSTTAAVNLRGLGPRATLVLLNGKRQTNDGGVGPEGVTAVDINALAPSIMIERVEVLTDGASALYGSDAVAGVVNMITRNNFEGFEVSATGMQVDRAGAGDYTIGALFGTGGENTRIIAGFESAARDEIITNDLYDFERLGIGTVSSFGNPGSFQPIGAMGGARRVPDPMCEDSSLGGTPIGGINLGSRCGLLLSLDRSLVAEEERLTGLTVVTSDLGGGISAELELGFSRARYGLVNNTFPINDPPRPVVPAENPGVSAAGAPFAGSDWQVWQRLRKPQDPVFAFRSARTSDTWRVAGSLSGDISESWNWRLSATSSSNDFSNVSGDTIRSRYDDALNGYGGPACGSQTVGAADSDPNCYWYNPFANSFSASPGDPQYNDPFILSYMFAEYLTEGFADLTSLDFVATGEINEWTSLAVGYQIREQGFEQDLSPLVNAGAFAFMNDAVPDYSGNRDANALFAELVMFPTEDLEVQLAARTEEYSGGANSTDPKIGLLWTPTDSVFVRATAGTSFRVAGEPQTFGIEAGRGAGVEMCGAPCVDPNSPTFGIPENIDAGSVTRGDPGLAPEQSSNFTLGVTWDVSDNLTIDLNYWSIDFEDLIVQESTQTIWYNDIADGTIDDPRIGLSPLATTNVISQMIANDILSFNVSFINEDSLETSGLDFRLDWQFEAGANAFGLGIDGTRNLSYDVTTPGGGTVDGLGSLNSANNGYATPEMKANVRFDWRRGGHFAQATLRHISALSQDQAADVADTIVKDFNTVDLIYRYAWNAFGGPVDVSAGVINATDEEDPQIGGLLTTVNTRSYDIRGRIYRVGFSKSFE